MRGWGREGGVILLHFHSIAQSRETVGEGGRECVRLLDTDVG